MRRTLRGPQFQRLIENKWVTSESTFVELAEWDRCIALDARPVISDRRLQIFVGLDVGLKHDSTAIVAVARQDERLRLVDHKIFIPKDGETLDIEATAEAAILELANRFDLRVVAFDPWQSVYLGQRLQRAGIAVSELPQSIPNLTAAAGNLLDLVKRQQLILYPSDDLREAITKVVAVESTRGFRIGKTKSSNRIDAIAALSFACLAAFRAEPRHEVMLTDFDGQVLYDSARERGDDSYFYKPPPPGARPPGSCAECGALIGQGPGVHEVKGKRLCAICFRAAGPDESILRA